MEALTRWDFWLAATALLTVLLLGAFAIYLARDFVKRWEKSVTVEQPTEADRLAPYSKMVDDGELSPEEFARIMAQMEGRAPPADFDKPPTANPPPNTSIQE
jgi:hypothetical protein